VQRFDHCTFALAFAGVRGIVESHGIRAITPGLDLDGEPRGSNKRPKASGKVNRLGALATAAEEIDTPMGKLSWSFIRRRSRIGWLRDAAAHRIHMAKQSMA
jgi:hypothetical protein